MEARSRPDAGFPVSGRLDTSDRPPLVAAVTMGYGHLRAAHAVADALGVEVSEVDTAPWAGFGERMVWRASKMLYGAISRASGAGPLQPAARRLLDRVTELPRDLERPVDHGASATMERLLSLGVGRGLARCRGPMIATFYAPALAAERLGKPRVACLVTDSDAHRVWAPHRPEGTRILFLAPTDGVEQRLASYGIPKDRIRVSGFPLPAELTDEAAVQQALARRLRRLDPSAVFTGPDDDELAARLGPIQGSDGRPPRVTFCVGGVGAQAGRARQLLNALRQPISEGLLRLTLVAGTDARLAARFTRWLRRTGLDRIPGEPVDVVCEPDFADYYTRFNQVLSDTDLLWTKPGELVFYAALGLPVVLDDPVGDHERRNLEWLTAAGAAVKRPAMDRVWRWLEESLSRGAFARLAWNGYDRLPRDGAARVADLLQTEFTVD
jgi:hypothetical protein